MKPGDYVTGIDRSFQRSIYKVVEPDPEARCIVATEDDKPEDIFSAVCISFDGVGFTSDGVHYHLSRNGYRLATPEEINLERAHQMLKEMSRGTY